jgi:hypothetical protein
MIDFAGGDDGPRIGRPHPVNRGVDVAVGYVLTGTDNHGLALILILACRNNLDKNNRKVNSD